MRPFRDASLTDVLRQLQDKLTEEIQSLDSDYVLKASPTELENYFVEKGRMEPLVLDSDAISIEGERGIDIDVSGDFNRAVFPGERAFVRGTQVDFAIPYSGNPGLWQFRPSVFGISGYPEIEVLDDRIRFSVSFPDDSADAESLKRGIAEQVQTLSAAVAHSKTNVDQYNTKLPAIIKEALERRRRFAERTAGVVAGLGIPLKRAGEISIHAVPVKRRPSPRTMPKVAPGRLKSEPTLLAEEYEYILGVLRSMSLVIERNPKAFLQLGEEDIRTHFLLNLNGHYEGAATGETFNSEGKTDILIRVEDRNVFIAECKFWKGAAAFDAAISQLLGYLSWRDSKCALLVFNRNRDSSAVSQKMHETMIVRAECKRALGADSRGDKRYVFVKASDPGREITITTLLFDMPDPDSAS